MKTLFKLTVCVTVLTSIFACSKFTSNEITTNFEQSTKSVSTKAIGEKTPIMAVYVETNDVNPLNVLDYYFQDDDSQFVDIVELFASNIRKETINGEVRPTLFLNDKLANILENGGVNKYIRPLQLAGIKVLLTNLGDHQGIGLANMNNKQAEQFATILAATVHHYGLDGIGFDDEYADYTWGSTNNSSYSQIITTLHSKLPSNKIITVFDWGKTNTITTEASTCIDYAYHGYFGQYNTSTHITGINTQKWSPISFNLGLTNSIADVKRFASGAKMNNYAAMMCFNLRTQLDNDPLPVFQAISDGAYNGRTVVCENGNRKRDVTLDPDGFTITYEMALSWLAQ